MKSTLKELGLTDKEIKVYLVLLSTGETSASVLAYKTSISPSTIHYLCERLKERGLVSSSRTGNIIYYAPENPEKILYMLEREKCEIIHKEEAVHRIMGELKALMDPEGILPRVRFRQGTEGMLEAHREFFEDLEKGALFCHFVNPIKNDSKKINDELLRMYLEAKEKKKFVKKTIMVDSPFAQYITKEKIDSPEDGLMLVSYDEAKHQHFYGSLVSREIVLDINFSEHDVLCVTTKHQGFASMRRELFELAWEEAKRQAGSNSKIVNSKF